MLEKFFWMGMEENQSQSHWDTSNSHPMMLLSGPPSCGKTSLLFQLAFNLGMDGNVTFICNRRKLENKPPFLSQGIDPSSPTFHRIQIKYLEDEEGILKFFSAFHLHSTFPSAVIIDDFGDFFDQRCEEKYGNGRGRDIAMVRTLALCHNALTLPNSNESRSCRLVLSDTHHGDSPRLMFIYKRWISTLFTITADGSGWFTLRLTNHNNSGIQSSLRTTTAKYSIALHFLILNQISEETEQ